MKVFLFRFMPLRALCALCVCLSSLAQAGCDDSSWLPSMNGAETVEDVLYGQTITREDGSNALEGDNIIWRDQEPYRLTLKADENVWENINWYLDADTPVKTGPSLTLDARILKEASHNLMFTGFRQGVPYSYKIPFTVKGSRSGEIGWIETEENSSSTTFDLASWTGYMEPLEKWKLWAVESSNVYFTVYKRDYQTITVEGTDAARLTKADLGAVVDGSTASPELDVFTVDTGDQEILFDGGELNFTLRVWEAGKGENTKQVAVNLELIPRLTGSAIFAVNDGRLERITADNVDAYSNDLYGTHAEVGFPAWGIDIAAVNNLAGALKWLDSYAASGTDGALKEYLVRVEKNEVLNKTVMTGSLRRSSQAEILVSYIKIRLRGYGAERRITHNPSDSPLGYLYKGSENPSYYLVSPSAFLSVTGSGLTLQLEENIAVDAAGGSDPNFPHEYMESIVEVRNYCTFILEQGARLTNGAGVYPVTIDSNGRFEMRGGEISYCKNSLCAIRFSRHNTTTGDPVGTFRYYSGVFRDNDSNLVHWPYYSYELYNAPKFRG